MVEAMERKRARATPPPGGWTALIDEICEGRWINPRTGEAAPRPPFDALRIEESLDGAEADLIADLNPEGEIAVVADEATWAAMGERVAKAVAGRFGGVREVVLSGAPHADMGEAAALQDRLDGAGFAVAVGGGTINDLVKYVTHGDGRRYCVFGTSASMDGYASTTASMTLESGLKISLPAHAARGVYLDLGVLSAAPPFLAGAGFGDCICSSVARIDWWMSHRVFGSFFAEEPYLIAEANDEEMNARAAGLATGDLEAVGYLTRALMLSGLGVAFTGVSNHGSMGEHQISHYIDCFAGADHPGALHGQQVGVASLTMARIQQAILSSEAPPVVRPTRIDPDDMARRMGPEIAKQCGAEYAKKAFDEAGAAAFNEKIASIWPELRAECLALAVPVEEMTRLLAASGAPLTAADMGLKRARYAEAVRHAHEMRNRFSFADIACDAGLLDDIAAGEG